MRKLFKTSASFIAGLLLAVGLTAGAASLSYFGFNPNTNLEGLHGFLASGGAAPTVTGSGGCGTLTNQLGGSTAGQVTIGTFSVSCTLTVTVPTASAAPNGWKCLFNDLTTPADTVPQASTTTTTCVTTAATVVTGDTIQYVLVAY